MKPEERITKLRKLRTSLSQEVEFLEADRIRLTELGFAETLLNGALSQLEVVTYMVEEAIRKERGTL